MDIYARITEQIIEKINNGILIWQKPWNCVMGAVSHSTGRPYSLINQFLLSGDMDVASGEYITYKQAEQAGGFIKKGQHSKLVVFYKILEKVVENESGELETKRTPYLKGYNVFEIAQCEGINRKFHTADMNPDANPIERAEKIIKDYYERENCKFITHHSDKAFYSPSEDVVKVPLMEQFSSVEEYYSTVFHETVHSTGHKLRCDRTDSKGNTFGDENYSREELVAEMGSAYLMNILGISTENVFDNSAAYLQGWSKALKEDKYLFTSAASRAEKAVKYILNENKEETEENK